MQYVQIFKSFLELFGVVCVSIFCLCLGSQESFDGVDGFLSAFVRCRKALDPVRMLILYYAHDLVTVP